MFKSKRIISLMIAMVIMCISVLPVFSQSTDGNEPNVYKLVFNLMLYARDYNSTFRLTTEQEPGALPLECDLESSNELVGVCDEVWCFYGEVCDGREPTIEEIDSYYERLDTAAKKVVLYRSELKFLIDHCNYEINDSLYYPQELWDGFQNSLENAVSVYTSEIEGIEVSNAYWDLKFSYNKLCVVSPVSGDVDNSRDLSVFDVTLVQKCVAKMCDFNSAQLTALDKSVQEDITIIEATKLQRTIAQVDIFSSYGLEVLSADTSRMNLNDNSVFQRYRYYKYVGRI